MDPKEYRLLFGLLFAFTFVLLSIIGGCTATSIAAKENNKIQMSRCLDAGKTWEYIPRSGDKYNCR